MEKSTALKARHDKRKDEIIAAARRRARISGFHAASMAQIAGEARLSVGQIYRYFANKDAIIEEIIRRIIDYRIAQVSAKAEFPPFHKVLAERWTHSEEDDALMLEVAAEATRNPQVAAMLAEANARIFDDVCAHMKRNHPDLSDARIRCCAEIMGTMMDGNMFRRLTPQKVDSEQLQDVMEKVINLIFTSE